MKNTGVSFALLLAGVAAVAGCDFQHKSTGSASPTAPSASTTSTPSWLGTWSSITSVGAPAATSPTGCRNFTWTVGSQTATDISGTFTALCLGTANIAGTGTGHVSGSTIAITLAGNGSMPGLPTCPFSVHGTGTIDGDIIQVPYSGSTCLGPLSGTQTLGRSLILPPPTPLPAPLPNPPPVSPAPSPVPVPDPGPVSAFDPRAAMFLNNPADVGYWPQTAKITAVDFHGSTFTFDFDRRVGPGRWPESAFGSDAGLQYTLGMCLKLNSQWYCSAAIQDRDGREPVAPTSIAENWYYDANRWGPMAGHQPANGEQIAIWVGQGNLRGSGNSTHERSDFVLMPFGGTYRAN